MIYYFSFTFDFKKLWVGIEYDIIRCKKSIIQSILIEVRLIPFIGFNIMAMDKNTSIEPVG